jgi:AsmA protein
VEDAPVAKTDKLLPDTPLPFDLLRTVDADVRLDIAEFRTRALWVRDVILDAQLTDGALKIGHFGLSDQRGGHMNISMDLLPDQSGGAEFSSSVNAENLVLGLKAETEEELQQLPTFELRSELSGSGGTTSEIAGSLNGHLRLLGGEGRIKAGGLDIFTQDFIAQVVRTINPFTQTDPYTNVDCSAVLLLFSDGVVSGSPAFVQQTDKLRIFANLEIDLKTEKLDAHISTTPQKGLGISVSNLINPYVKLTGTLAKPALALDAQSVVVEGGVAVATAGLSILAKSFKNRYLSEKDPCGKAVAEAEEFLEAQKK